MPTDQVIESIGPVLMPCRAVDPELFFAELPFDVEQAKRICVPCILKDACLAGALARSEPHGVWGGELVMAGVVVPHKRPRGRPRKVEVAAQSCPASAGDLVERVESAA